jgi:hypothetical protein
VVMFSFFVKSAPADPEWRMGTLSTTTIPSENFLFF